MRKELLARIIVVVLVVAALIFPILAYWNNTQWIEVHAAMPDKGGWLQTNITTRVDESLKLRLVSDDVVHSFALGQSDFTPVDLLPGQPVEVTLTFDEPGTYTYFCTRWCGEDHWRMRGTITVTGNSILNNTKTDPPLYQQLGIDLDAPHELHDLALERQPSSEMGKNQGLDFPLEYLDQAYYRSHSPYQAWNDLRESTFTNGLNDSQIWDLVAWIWQQNSDPAQVNLGKTLYQRDCVACHGESGAGYGVFGIEKTSENNNHSDKETDSHSVEEPANFRDYDHMLSVSPALLQGKIIRGGMGTGMPSWGLIYTKEQSWSLVTYLWTFIFP